MPAAPPVLLEPSIALFDSTGRLVDWNRPFAEEFARVGPLLVRGMSYADLLRAARRDTDPSESEADRERWLAERLDRFRRGRTRLRYRNDAGGWVQVEERLTSNGGILRFAQVALPELPSDDQMQAALEHAEAQLALLRAVVVHSSDAVLVLEGDPADGCDSRVVYANPAFERLLGWSVDEIIGLPASSFDSFGASPTLQDEIRQALESRAPARFELEAVCKNGERVWTELDIVVLQTREGRSWRWATIQRDIRPRRVAEAAMRQARDSAEAANRAKGQFLAQMSHELRTPLNVIIGFAEILETGLGGSLDPQKTIEYAADIGASGRHLLSLVNDILDLSKIEAGRLELDRSKIDLGALVQRCLPFVSAAAEEKRVQLEFEPPAGHVYLDADPLRMKQVVINLLSNAIKFTDGGGSVTVRMERSEDAVRVRIRDTGCGMTEEQTRKAVLPFIQIDSSLSRMHEGSGLGLPIAKQLVELHGGRLEIDSRPGTGTEMVIALPP